MFGAGTSNLFGRIGFLSMALTSPTDSTFARRVVMVAQSLSHPRYHRRAKWLRDAGWEVTAYSFDRADDSPNRFPQGVEIVSLGVVRHGRYLSRISTLLRAIGLIRARERALHGRRPVLYAFGLDSAAIALMLRLKGSPLVYEIGDLRNPEPKKNLLTRLLAVIEARVVRKSEALIVTSPAFVDHYFAQLDDSVKARTLVLENKLPADCAGWVSERKERVPGTPVRIGFVGNLRYEHTLRPLMEAVAKAPGEFSLSVFGAGRLRPLVEEYAGRFENIAYHGPFRNPDDLPTIYSQIDVSYVVYDNRDANVRLALPNKLYESLLFGVPLIVASGTELSRRVHEAGAGFIVSPAQSGFAAQLLKQLTPEAIQAASRRALQTNAESLFESGSGVIRVFESL